MAILRSDIVTNVRELMDDTDIDAASITNAANWFVQELCNNNHLRIMEDSATLSGLDDATTLAFPITMQTMVDLYVTSPTVYNLKELYMPYGEFMKLYADFATATPMKVRQWTDWGNAMRFAAPLDGAHTIKIDFLRKPVKMVSDANECEIPDNYDEMVYLGTKVRLMDVNEDYAEANQERDNKLTPLVTAFVRNESRGQIKTGPVVIRTNRRRTSRDY